MASQYTQCHQIVMSLGVAAQTLGLDQSCGNKHSPKTSKSGCRDPNASFYVAMAREPSASQPPWLVTNSVPTLLKSRMRQRRVESSYVRTTAHPALVVLQIQLQS